MSRGFGYRGQGGKPLLRDGFFRGFRTPACKTKMIKTINIEVGRVRGGMENKGSQTFGWRVVKITGMKIEGSQN